MFNKLDTSTGEQIRIFWNGVELLCHQGDSVAAALLSANHTIRRSVVSDAPRGPYCMMGVCFDCLVTIDGQPNQQSCLVDAKQGMVVESQQGRTRVSNL